MYLNSILKHRVMMLTLPPTVRLLASCHNGPEHNCDCCHDILIYLRSIGKMNETRLSEIFKMEVRELKHDLRKWRPVLQIKRLTLQTWPGLHD